MRMFLQSRLVRGQTSMNLGRNLDRGGEDPTASLASNEVPPPPPPPGASPHEFHALEDVLSKEIPSATSAPRKSQGDLPERIHGVSWAKMVKKWKSLVEAKMHTHHVRFYEPSTHQKAWAPRPHHVSFSGTMWVDLTIVGVLYRLDEFFLLGAIHDSAGFWVPFMVLLAIYDAWEFRPMMQAEFRTKGISFIHSFISLVSWLLLALMGSTIPYKADSSSSDNGHLKYEPSHPISFATESNNSSGGTTPLFQWAVYDQTVFAYLKLIHGAVRVLSYLEIVLFSKSKRARIAAKPRLIMYFCGTLILAIPPILISEAVRIQYVVFCYLGSYLVQKGVWSLIFFLDLGGMKTMAHEKDNLLRVNMPFIITRLRDWTQLQLGACVLGLITASDLVLTNDSNDGVGARYFVVITGYFFIAFLDMYSYASEPRVFTDHALIVGGWYSVFWFDCFLLLTMSLLGVAVGLRYIFQHPMDVVDSTKAHIIWLLAVCSTLSLIFIVLQEVNHKSGIILDTRRRVWIIKAILAATCMISPSVILGIDVPDEALYWVTFNLCLSTLAVLVVHAVNGGFRREVAKKTKIRLRGHLLAVVIARKWLHKARQNLDAQRNDFESGRSRNFADGDMDGMEESVGPGDEMEENKKDLHVLDVFEDHHDDYDYGEEDDEGPSNQIVTQQPLRPPSLFERLTSFRSSRKLETRRASDTRSASIPAGNVPFETTELDPLPETEQDEGQRYPRSSRRIAAGLAMTADIEEAEEAAQMAPAAVPLGSRRGSLNASNRDRPLNMSRRSSNPMGTRRGSENASVGGGPSQSRRGLEPSSSRRDRSRTPNTSRRGLLPASTNEEEFHGGGGSRRSSLATKGSIESQPMVLGFRGGEAEAAGIEVIGLNDENDNDDDGTTGTGDSPLRRSPANSLSHSRRSRGDPAQSGRRRLYSDLNGSKRSWNGGEPNTSRRQRAFQLVKDVNSSVRKRVFGTKASLSIEDMATANKPVAIRVLRKVMNERFYELPHLLVEQDVFAEYSLSWSDLFLDIIYIGVVYRLGDYLLTGLGLSKSHPVEYSVSTTVFLFVSLFYAVFSLWWVKLSFSSKCGVSDVFHKGLDMLQGLFVVLCALNITSPQEFQRPGAIMPFVVTAFLMAFHISMWFLWTEVLFSKKKDVTTKACANRNIRREYLSLFALFLAFLSCGLKGPLELTSLFWALSWLLPFVERLLTVKMVKRAEHKAPFLLRYVLHRLGDGNLILLGEGVFQIIRSVSQAYQSEVFIVFTLSFLNITAMRVALFEMDCFDEHARKHVVLHSRWGYLFISFLRSLASPAVVSVGVALKSIVAYSVSSTTDSADDERENSCYALNSKQVQIFQILSVGNLLALASFVLIYHVHRTYNYRVLAWKRCLVQIAICLLFLLFPWLPCMSLIGIASGSLAVWCIAIAFHAITDDLFSFHQHDHHHEAPSPKIRKSLKKDRPLDEVTRVYDPAEALNEALLRRKAKEEIISESRHLLKSLRDKSKTSGDGDQEVKYIFRSSKNLLADLRHRANSVSSVTKAFLDTLTPSPAPSKTNTPFGSRRKFSIPPINLGGSNAFATTATTTSVASTSSAPQSSSAIPDDFVSNLVEQPEVSKRIDPRSDDGGATQYVQSIQDVATKDEVTPNDLAVV